MLELHASLRYHVNYDFITNTFSALTLLVGQQEEHPVCKKNEWWGAGMVICLEQGADLHMAQLMPLPLTVSCFSKIQIGFTFLVLALPGSPGKRAVNLRVCAYACLCACVCVMCVMCVWFYNKITAQVYVLHLSWKQAVFHCWLEHFMHPCHLTTLHNDDVQ